MKQADIDRYADNIVKHVAAQIDFALQPIRKRLDELEAMPKSVYRGTWAANEHYEKGNQVSHSGSLWLSTNSNFNSKPGTSSSWKMVDKRGRAELHEHA